MATSATFYLNASTFALATAAFADVNLTILAPDGFYSDGTGVVREQVLGTLGAITACEGCGTKTPVYGNIYNWYAVNDLRGIAPAGWHVPDWSELLAFNTYISGYTDGAQRIKSSSSLYWSPSTGTDIYGFDFRGGGYRDNSGAFLGLKTSGFLWQSSSVDPTNAQTIYCVSYLPYTNTTSVLDKRYGLSVRLLKDDSVDTGTVIDYDGNVYPTITIGSQVWMASNLIVQHYNNGDVIPNVTVNSDWSPLTTGALCYYDNDVNNAYII